MRPLNTVLRIDRTLDGAEIDKLIADLDAVKALAIEHRRRAHWRQRESSASSFAAEYGHADDASLPDPAPDQMRLSATSMDRQARRKYPAR